MRKRVLRTITLTLVAALFVAVFPAEPSYAALSKVSYPARVTTFKSTQNFEDEYLRAYIPADDDSLLKVVYRTPLETSLFRLSLYRIGENKGDMHLNIFIQPIQKTAADGSPTYNFTYYLSMEDYDIPDGRYNIYIRRCATAEDAAALDYKSSGVLNKNMVVEVKNGKPRLLRYQDVINYNRSIQAIGDLYDLSRYLDPALEDIRFVLRNPATNVYSTMTADKIAFFQTISDRVCNGAYSDYDKLRKIYEYAAANFYYDTIAFQTHSNQYADPYENIRNFEYGLSSVNSQTGKVYTTCQGYSAIVIALARAQKIPCRLVYGHRLAVPSNDWLTENNIDVRDHWWVEAWVNGRWVFIDPTVGTTNKYNSSTGVWATTGLTNYTYFDPSEEQIATSHVYMNIYPDYRYGKYITNEAEISTLLAFLNSTSTVDTDSDDYSYFNKTETNGRLLNPAYSPYDKETWGDGKKSHFMTDGRGNVSQIQWSDKGFTGALNLPDFKKMTLLSSHDNGFTSADLSGCTKLKKVYLYDNALTSLDLSDCRALSYVRVQDNPLKTLSIYVNGRNRTFTAEEHGTFYFTTDSRYVDVFSLYAQPELGYKLKGVYSTSTGNRLSTKTTWHFKPQAFGYALRFTLDPDSYKYILYPDEARSSRLPYVQAAAKRLAELGYYQPASGQTVGEEKRYDATMVEAAVKFQVVNAINNTGNIGKTTWAALFSENAIPMVEESTYPQVLADYEAHKAAEADAKADMATVTVKASSTAGKGVMKLKWTVSGPVAGAPAIVTSNPAQDGTAVLTQDPTALGISGYEVYRSTKKTSGYKKLFTFDDPEKLSCKNTSGIKKGNRYYYKVRAFRQVGEKKFYTAWSNITYKTAK